LPPKSMHAIAYLYQCSTKCAATRLCRIKCEAELVTLLIQKVFTDTARILMERVFTVCRPPGTV
jgi:hypothetical protein